MRVAKYGVLILYLLITISIVGIFGTTVSYADDFLPDYSSKYESDYKPTYKKYSNGVYTFDTESPKGLAKYGFNIVGAVNMISSIIFQFIVVLNRLTLMILQMCFKTNIFELLPDILNTVIISIKDALFEWSAPVLIMAGGLVGLMKAMRRSHVTGIKTVFWSVLVFILSTMFFRNPAGFGSGINKIVETISAQVLYQTARSVGGETGVRVSNGDDAVMILSNQYWEIATMKPYEQMQFGSTKGNDLDKFLALSDNDRQKKVDTLAKTNNRFGKMGAVTRLGELALNFFLILAYDVFVIMISVPLLVAQVSALYLITFAGFIFLISLIPDRGANVLLKWGISTFGFLGKKLVLTIMISIYFSLIMGVYNTVSNYVIALLLNILFIGTAIIMNKKINQLIADGLAGHDSGVTDALKKETLSSKVTKGLAGVYFGNKVYDGYKAMKNNRDEKKFNKDYDGVADQLLDRKYTEEKEQARDVARRKLNQRFGREKHEAEERANEKGNPVEYSKFVKDAMDREKSGNARFTAQQVENVAKDSEFVREVDQRKSRGWEAYSTKQKESKLAELYAIKKEGNDPKRLLYPNVEGKTSEDIREKVVRGKAEDKQNKDRRLREVKENRESIEDNIESKVFSDEFNAKSFVKSVSRAPSRTIKRLSKQNTKVVDEKTEDRQNTTKTNVNNEYKQETNEHNTRTQEHNTSTENKNVNNNTTENKDINNNTTNNTKTNNNTTNEKVENNSFTNEHRSNTNTKNVTEDNFTNIRKVASETINKETSIVEKTVEKVDVIRGKEGLGDTIFKSKMRDVAKGRKKKTTAEGLFDKIDNNLSGEEKLFNVEEMISDENDYGDDYDYDGNE